MSVSNFNSLNEEIECYKRNFILTSPRHWTALSRVSGLSEEFIRTFADKLNWKTITQHQNLTETFIEEFQNKINWHELYFNKSVKFFEEFITKFIKKFNKLDLVFILQNCHVSEEFLDKFSNKIDLTRLPFDYNLSRNFIRKYKDKVNWSNVSAMLTSEDEKSFIKEFSDKIVWSELHLGNFSKEFCLKHLNKFTDFQKSKINFSNVDEMIDVIGLDKINWYQVCTEKILSEDFIRKFQDKVNWKGISKYQNLTEAFIEEFADKVDWTEISANQRLSKKFVKKFANKVDWYNICKYQNFDFEFLFENRNYYLEQNIQKIPRDITKEEFSLMINTKEIFKQFINCSKANKN